MGLKQSKKIKFIKKNGLNALLLHTFFGTRLGAYLLRFYLRLVLNKAEYKTFRLAYQHFRENYRNIIAISPLFFMKNLRKHIAWIESKSFQDAYGNIKDFMSNAQLHDTSILSNSYPPPPIVS